MPAKPSATSSPYVLTLVLVLLVLAAIACMWYTRATAEAFYSCPNCGTLSAWGCADCRSCGVCTTPDGRGECVVGDQQGPFFRADCVGWTYGGRCEAGYCRGVVPPVYRRRYRLSRRPRASWWSRTFAPWRGGWRGGWHGRRRR